MIPVWIDRTRRTEVNGIRLTLSQEFVYSVSGFYVGNGSFLLEMIGMFLSQQKFKSPF